MKRNTAILRGIASVMALLTMLCMTATTLTFTYAGIINSYLNINTTKIIQPDNADGVIEAAYDNEYGTDSSNNQAALLLELDVASENIAQAEEGTVLLTNHNNVLPLSENAGVTLFGNGAFHSVGTSSKTPFEAIVPATLTSALQDALGAEKVNAVLGEQVYAELGTTSGTEIVEGDIAKVKENESTWQNKCNDAAIVVLSRAGGESSDAAMTTAEGRHYLALSSQEEALMIYLKEQKDAGIFDSIIVLINSEQAMELGWLDTYGVDACLVIGRPGATGYTGVVNILTGVANPSGRLVDTYASDSLSAPATIFAGENTQSWANLDWVEKNDADYGTDGSENNWIVYAEGIYVGYKYYETRYEDTVTDQGNARGTVGSSTGNAWNYSDEVNFTFGDGLSYTTFDQTLDQVKYNAESDAYEVEVTVTNTGEVAGRNVVQIYAQTPYGDYEKENHVEKSAIQFVGMGKTGDLKPGESEKITVTVERYFLASYDTDGAKGYILSEGDYYLALGNSAHDALNNVLSAKGYSKESGMDYDGNAALTYTWNQAQIDTDSYRYSEENGTEITNQFDFADLNHYGIDFTYLSRNDWEGTYPAMISVEMSEEMLKDMVADWYDPADYAIGEEYTFGADNGISFADLYYTDYDDEETWNAFLDQLTIEEMLTLLSDNDGYEAINSVGMPGMNRTDDNIGIGSLTCTGTDALTWVSEVTTSRTWNTERFSERGRLLGIEAVFCDANEIWYGGGNIHRTAFGGRNNQYYAEDGNYGYLVGAYEAEAMQNVGVIYCIKHFALNDQETGRNGISTFTNEQALREIYLRSFEGAFRKGGAMSVMTAFNRIGCVPNNADSALLNNVLRGEWGFKGHITSDGYSSLAYKNHFAEFLVTGQDYYCMDAGMFGSSIGKLIDQGDTAIITALRRAAKNDLYVDSRSIAVNGLTNGSIVVTVVPGWQKAMLIATAVFAVGFVGCVIAGGITMFSKRKDKQEEEG